MEIISIRTEKIWAGPGVDAHEGEIKTWDDANNRYLYIHCSFYAGTHFTVSHQSVMDYLLNDNADQDIEFEFIEEYDDLFDAMTSEYIDGFILLNNLLNEMADFTYGRRESIYNYIVSPIEFEEVGDNVKGGLIASFQYKTKSMKNAVQRKAFVYMSDGFVTRCGMYDENHKVVESFEDVEAAERSKWMLLYQNIAERLGDCMLYS